MTADATLVEHYASGDLRARIETALATIDGPITRRTLGPLDQFHIGGAPATEWLIEQIDLASGARVIDLGSGLGGPARHIAGAADAHVTGIDLTDEYVAVATWLSELVGLGDTVTFRTGSVLELERLLVDQDPFDAATMLHVGMNIADKAELCRQVAATLQPGAIFGVYDVMSGPNFAAEEPVTFPVPWASVPDHSFVASAAAYTDALVAAGFVIEAVHDRTSAALAARGSQAAAAQSTAPPSKAAPSPLGLHLVMGTETKTKVANMVANVRSGRIAPTVIVARRV